MMDPVLRTERLVLRPFQAQDLERYVDYYTSEARTAGVGGAKPRHVVVERFFAMAGQWAIRGYGRYAVAHSADTPAFGHVGMMAIDGAPEMTWTLWDEGETGKGYATEAAQAAMTNWFAMGNTRCIAHVDASNMASIKVAERLGMTRDINATPPHWMPGAYCYVKDAA